MKTNNQIGIITSSANPRVKELKKLRQRGNDDAHKFLVVGSHHIGSALEAGWKVDELFLTTDILDSEFGKNAVEQVLEGGGEVVEVTSEIFNAMTEKDHNRGMLAVCNKRVFSLDSLLGKERIVALVKPQDPGNVGTILRTLDSVGGGGLILIDGGIKPYHPSFLRASMGSIFWNPVVQCDFQNFSVWRATNGYRLIGTSAKGTLGKMRPNKNEPTILLFGSEQKGLEPNQVEACDEMVSLPMKGHHSSLNIAVAAGILLYRFFGEKN